MRWLVGTAVLGGCFAPAAPAGVPCDPGGTCPSGQSCLAVPGGGFACQPDGSGPGSDGGGGGEVAPGDRDHDGVADEIDNCPDAANPLQENEDGDRFGDACDPCPPIADPDPIVDPDGDGVSGACDPFPTVGGDKIVLFESFNGTTTPPGWVAVGPWTFANGAAKVTAVDGATNLLTLPRAHPTKTAVITALTVDASNFNNPRFVGPIQFQQLDKGIACELDRNGAGPQLTIHDISATGTINVATTVFDDGTQATIVNR